MQSSKEQLFIRKGELVTNIEILNRELQNINTAIYALLNKEAEVAATPIPIVEADKEKK